MKYQTLEAITQNVIYEISQVPGVSVQTYAEPVIERKIQHHFDAIFNEGWWRQFYTPNLEVFYSSHTGLPVNDFTASPVIRGVDDVRWIWHPSHVKPLPELQDHFNREEIGTGTSPQFWEAWSTDEKLFRILPIPDPTMAAAEDTTSYSVHIAYRSRPDDFGSSDTIRFDSLYLTYAVCHDILSTDADNPGDVEKYSLFAQKRLAMLKGALAKPFKFNQRGERVPTDWFTS